MPSQDSMTKPLLIGKSTPSILIVCIYLKVLLCLYLSSDIFFTIDLYEIRCYTVIVCLHVVKADAGKQSTVIPCAVRAQGVGTVLAPSAVSSRNREDTTGHASDLWKSKADLCRNTPKLQKCMLPRGSTFCRWNEEDVEMTTIHQL